MEIIISIISILIGLFVTHKYYKITTKDQVKIYNKLSENLRREILENPNDIIRHDELKAILHNIQCGPIDASRLTGDIDCGKY